MFLRDVRVLYLRELRAALRERNIVVNSLLLPLLLYPGILWLIFSAITFVRGREEQLASRIVVSGLPEAHARLSHDLAADEDVELVDPLPAGDPAAAVRSTEVDAWVEAVPAAEDGAALDGNFRLRVTYDASRDRSARAETRLVEALDGYRADWIAARAHELGATPEEWNTFRLERLDVATGEERGAFVFGIIAPLLTIIMIAVGCLYPAVDATAGERERSTWETSMTLAVSRRALVTAKFLYVATLGSAAGLLNLTGLLLTMRGILASAFGGAEVEDLVFEVPLAAVPLLVVTTLLLALFIAAGMMIFAAFARTFKEGQSMVGPFYLLCLLPALFVQAPDLTLTARWALVPIANVALLFRDAISGHFDPLLIALVLAVEAVTVVACLAVARWVLQFEEILIGSYSGSLLKFAQQRLRRREAAEVRRDG